MTAHAPVGEVHVWVARVADACTPERSAYYQSLLSDDERQRLQCLRSEALRREYLLTRTLSRHCLSHYCPVAPAQWRFQRSRFGRPYVRHPMLPPLQFNLSNTRSWVACLIAPDMPAGIDVECLARGPEVLELGSRCFTQDEWLALQGLPIQLRGHRAAELWALKESYVKAVGMGLSVPLSEVDCDVSNLRLRRLPPLAQEDVADSARNWQSLSVVLDGDHVLSLSLRRGAEADLRVSVRIVVPTAGEGVNRFAQLDGALNLDPAVAA